jgi:hypothetical protein
MDAPRISDSIRVCEHSESGSGLFEGKEPWVCPAAQAMASTELMLITRKTERIVNSFHTLYRRMMEMRNMIKEG